MKFDPENRIHLEKIGKNYEHMDVLEEINNEAFPASEKVSIAYLVSIPDLTMLHVNAIVDGDVPVGFIIWVDLCEGFSYLSYLAIDQQYRNRRYGSKALTCLFDNVLTDTVSFGVIEAPDPDAENNDQRVTRKRFYERLGFTVFENTVGFFGNDKFHLVYHGCETAEEVLLEKFGQLKEFLKKYIMPQNAD